ncbi:carboxylate-amine ligase [Rhodopseudomonas sp.]|uniref:carboxylate-amine ligase n=1 Tax=Rhodopseudomonas sp. TaxID=1078 RepID=UPI003B3B24DF
MQFDPKIIERLRLNLSGDQSHIVIRSAAGSDAEAAGYSFGIEEEYFLADAKTGEAAILTPNELFEAANWSTGGQVMREMLQAQIEVATNVHVDPKDARQELRFLRREVAAVAAQYGLVIMACSTHPTASWRASQPTPKPRYFEMIENLQVIGYRNMLCGMHVHVQLPQPEKRFPVMCAMIPHLPLFLALSTSSPFWSSENTGLRGYRLAAYSELPRTGLPELFEDQRGYEDYINALVKSGVIPDESHVWWAMRPSFRHPTLELRAPDVCTRLDDAVAIACLYRALVRHLGEMPETPKVDAVERAIAVENKWRAQRYGTGCSFASRDGAVPIAQALDRVIELVREDAEMLGCLAEVESCRNILRRGSSADAQLRVYEESGCDLAAVTRWIAEETIAEASQPPAAVTRDAVN